MHTEITDVHDEVVVGRITDLLRQATGLVERGGKLSASGRDFDAAHLYRQAGGQIRTAENLARQIVDPAARAAIERHLTELLEQVWGPLDLEEHRAQGRFDGAPGPGRGGNLPFKFGHLAGLGERLGSTTGWLARLRAWLSRPIQIRAAPTRAEDVRIPVAPVNEAGVLIQPAPMRAEDVRYRAAPTTPQSVYALYARRGFAGMGEAPLRDSARIFYALSGVIAAALSYSGNKSVPWAVVHGALGPVYLAYRAIKAAK